MLYRAEYFKHKLSQYLPSSFPLKKKNFWSSCLRKGYLRTDKVRSIAYFVKDDGTTASEDIDVLGRGAIHQF
jgi:hypothetical protein